MGIRSLLRNAFGRSKAAREESGASPSGTADKPESATIPEAREEATPAPAPEAEVPAARTAPTEAADAAPSPAPTTASLPAQSSPVDRAETPVRTGTPSVREESADDAPTATEPAEADAEPTAEAAGDEPATAPADKADTVSELVSQAFDNPSPAAPAPTEAATEAADEPVPAEDEAKSVAVEEPKAEEKAEEKAEPKEEAAAEAEAPAAAAPEEQPAAEAEAAEAAPEEPELEAHPQPEPQAAAEPEPQPAEAEAEATETSESTKSPEVTEDAKGTKDTESALATTAPALVSLYKAAGTTLEKHGLGTQRAAVYLVLDRSGSMRNYYKDGTVQNLAEQALGLAANFDDDAVVPVVFFSTDVDGTAEIDLTNYEGRIEELHAGLGHMGRTNYHWAVNAVVEHYKKSGSTAPAFVIFQTDGAPTSKPAAERALCEAAELPIFWQFIGFGDPDAKGFDFLRKLDDLAVPEKRAVDNAGFFHAGRDPRSLSHDELYQQLMVEFPEWLTEARAAGVVKDD
ncbi:VWA domain-containing protein [Streptomyces sp. NPDC048595]|uniref:vWA domain-containing protein n=1 Tax=Streptomyces sp. NPDC048595 TaxID=3365576 RepID=UPI00371510C6